jgi:hypothetical protein
MKTTNKKPKRPFSVTVLGFGVLISVLLQLTRMVSGIIQSQLITRLPLSISPVYFIITGLVWAVVGLINIYSTWLGKSWAAGVVWWSTVGYSLYYWLDELLVKQSPLRTTNWPFLITLNLLILVITYGFFRLPKVDRFIGECNERKPEDPRTER